MRRVALILGLAVLCLAPPLRADEPKKKAEAKTVQVPYRLTDTLHILVRAKINGKGPYNFILDTGAPALFVSTEVCKTLGIEADKKGWATFDRFELEGGLVVNKAKGRIEDPFQVKGMNKMGLAGVELHGMIGYTLLARYRITYDFTKDKLAWTELEFEPPTPQGLAGGATAGMDAMAGLSEMLAGFLGRKGKAEVVPRGFLGIEWADRDADTRVKRVLDQGPAAAAGVKADDRISHFQGKEVKTGASVQRMAQKLTAGEEVKLTVVRGSETLELTLKAGEGL